MIAWAQSEAERGGILAMVVLSVWIVGGVQEGRRERGRAREVLGEREQSALVAHEADGSRKSAFLPMAPNVYFVS